MFPNIPVLFRKSNVKEFQLYHALSVAGTATAFTVAFDENMQYRCQSCGNRQSSPVFCENMTAAFKVAAQMCLALDAPSRPHKPRIRATTLKLLDQRIAARKVKDSDPEKSLTAAINASVKCDRTDWLNRLLCTGSWVEIRKLRKDARHKLGRLRDLCGQLVETDMRAETLAKFLEAKQWAFCKYPN